METFTDIAFDVVQDAVLDTLYLIPFLFVVYLAMEWLEHKAGQKSQETIRRAGAAGPALGAVLGVIPQCGFSAAASTLYAGRVITLGTLIAVFLSTSDEMLPIFIAEQVSLVVIVEILGLKLLIGMSMGFIIDAVLRIQRRDEEKLRIHELCKQDGCECSGECETCKENPELAYEHDQVLAECECEHHHHEHEHDHECECEHHHAHQHTGSHIVKSALKHTVQVTVFILVISLAINALLACVGEEALGEFVAANQTLSVFAAALVGLIPNCAASVAIAQLYVEGVLGAGAMMAGLLTGAGVGLLVLVRSNRRLKQNIWIIVLLWCIGVAWGLVFSLLGVTF